MLGVDVGHRGHDYFAPPGHGAAAARVEGASARPLEGAGDRSFDGNQALPDPVYRAERDRELLARCDALNLPMRAPHSLYAGKLSPANEAALLLKHTAFRDAVQGRAHMAALGRNLANLVYRGEATDAQLRDSPLYPTLRDILGRERMTET